MYEISLERLRDQHYRAFVNGTMVGNIYIKKIKYHRFPRLIFRCSKNPFKNVIQSLHRDPSGFSIGGLIHADRVAYSNLMAVIVRNYVRNFEVNPPLIYDMETRAAA